MRIFSFSTLPMVALGLGLGLGLSGAACAQTCTGLCLQQIQCPGNGTTSVNGVVYAPNGTEPLPNVTVYVPNDTVQPFTAGVSCPISGSPPSGSPLVGTITDVNGKFTLVDMPVGANIPLVIVSGRWRRQLVIPGTTACTNTALPPTFAVMPQNQTQGDIPKIAIATGSADQVECVLLKMGISQSEFTDPGVGGRINLYAGSGSKGEIIDHGHTQSDGSDGWQWLDPQSVRRADASLRRQYISHCQDISGIYKPRPVCKPRRSCLFQPLQLPVDD